MLYSDGRREVSTKRDVHGHLAFTGWERNNSATCTPIFLLSTLTRKAGAADSITGLAALSGKYTI